MAFPIPTHKHIDTPFGVAGHMWGSGHHEGVDFDVPIGTPVDACANGLVMSVGHWGPAFGPHSPVIRHKIIMGGKQVLVYTIYAHLSVCLVKPGQVVVKGQPIGRSGNLGNVTGPHLHLEMQLGPNWERGGGRNPAPLLAA